MTALSTLMEKFEQRILVQNKTLSIDRNNGKQKSDFKMTAPTVRIESNEQFQPKGMVRSKDFRSRTKIEIHSNKPNTSFNLENVEMIAKSIVGRQILLLSKGSIIVFKDINFSLHKKYLQRLKPHNHPNKENTTEVQSSVLYRVRPKEIYTIKKPLSSIIQAENILCEYSCQIYYDVANNSFTHMKSPLLCKSKHNDGNTVRGNAAIFASHKSRHCSVLPPRPVSLDPNGFKQLERRQWQHWKCVVIAPWTATGPRSRETSNHSPVTQPSDDTVDGSPVNIEYDRDLSVDQYSFYQPMVRPFNTRQRDALIRQNDRRQRNPAFREFVEVQARLKSFHGRWPHPAHVQDFEQLSKLGFFYTGNKDLTRCNQCGIGLKDWSETDDPLVEHVRYSPDCPFLIDTIPSTRLAQLKASLIPNNIISTREPNTTYTEGHRAQTASGGASDDVILGVVPRNPQYSLKAVRLSSFSKWPMDIIQTPMELATAGFFYTGTNDIVRCYVCDGGLQKWSAGDDPWVEHARWFPHCAYVRQVKGEDYIELVRLSAEQDRLEEERTASGRNHSNAYVGRLRDLHLAEKQNDDSTEVNGDSISELMGIAVSMGFSEEITSHALADMRRRGKLITKETFVNFLTDLSTAVQQQNCDSSRSKSESGETVEDIVKETEHLRSIIQCTECDTNESNCLFLPCAHHIMCVSCAEEI